MSVLVPPEITDNIIALVDSGQTATFLACSLVCRDWLPASRRRLFETVHFSRHHLYDLFLTRILRSVTMRWWLSYVLNVKISDPWSPLGKEAPRLDERRTNRFIHEFAGRLPNLQELSFEDADWIIRPPHPSVSVVCRNFSSVRQLALFRCRFPSFGAFRSMLASFPHLEHLDIFAIAWPGAQLSPIPMAVHDGSPSLRTFRMSAGGPELCAIAITRWLALTRTARTVKDVHLGKFFASTYLAFLQAAAASLTTLGTPLLTGNISCDASHCTSSTSSASSCRLISTPIGESWLLLSTCFTVTDFDPLSSTMSKFCGP
ncbi:hypothetical protein C8Q80DRAFT_119197 [Daedaleopsis nitida]|nr:hypothetical protein C8Q80DRAFT_119197 [Daedaleopsis nitida]